jgi:hypothetical protein
MKKLLLLMIVLLAGMTVSAQVQRNVVIQEIGTGTWCTYCPGAANGAQQLLNSGAHVAIIEYHNGDAFTNNASNARNNYYSLAGYPTAHLMEHTNMKEVPHAPPGMSMEIICPFIIPLMQCRPQYWLISQAPTVAMCITSFFPSKKWEPLPAATSKLIVCSPKLILQRLHGLLQDV